MKHVPLPFHITEIQHHPENDTPLETILVDPAGVFVCSAGYGKSAKRDAPFILLACNNFERLLNAAKTLMECISKSDAATVQTAMQASQDMLIAEEELVAEIDAAERSEK